MAESAYGYRMQTREMVAVHVSNIRNVRTESFVRVDKLNPLRERFITFSSSLRSRLEETKTRSGTNRELEFRCSFGKFILIKMEEIFSKIENTDNAEFLANGNRFSAGDDEVRFNPRLLASFLSALQFAEEFFSADYFTEDHESLLAKYIALEPFLAACSQVCKLEYPDTENLEAAIRSQL